MAAIARTDRIIVVLAFDTCVGVQTLDEFVNDAPDQALEELSRIIKLIVHEARKSVFAGSFRLPIRREHKTEE